MLRTIGLAGVLFGFVALLGCNKESAAPMQSMKAAAVKVSTPITKPETEYEEFTGMTQAIQTVEVRAHVSGYLSKIYFMDKEGAEVEKGEPLFEIDPRPFKAELAQQEANLVAAQAHADRLTQDLRRDEKLARGVISQADFDKTVGDQKEAVAAVGSARAARDRAKLNLEYTQIRAPLTGRISRRMIDEWNMVKADDTALTTIVSLNEMYAVFDVDEATALKLRRLVREKKLPSLEHPYLPVEVGLADEEGYPHKGTVDFVDNQLDGGTGTLRMRGIFPNKDRLLTPGLFVRVRLPLGAPHPALLVAEEAILRDQGQKYVFVANDANKVEYRRVKVGKLYNGLREVIDGLKPNDRVIINGLQRVREKADVAPTLVEMPQQAAKRE